MRHRSASRLMLAFAALTMLCACNITDADNGRPDSARAFPEADRPISPTGATQFANERARDDRGEANIVMELADIRPGMSIADIGAGEGYYTSRLAERVGPGGRVLAQDINQAVLQRLGARVERERLDNVSIKLGRADDPQLPEDSFDRIFLVHMYHEVSEPYAFLWRLRPALRKGGQVIVVDVDRPMDRHGIPPAMLFCEFQAVGLKLAAFIRRPELAGYYARFEADGARPDPADIEPCTQDVAKQAATAQSGLVQSGQAQGGQAQSGQARADRPDKTDTANTPNRITTT